MTRTAPTLAALALLTLASTALAAPRGLQVEGTRCASPDAAEVEELPSVEALGAADPILVCAGTSGELHVTWQPSSPASLYRVRTYRLGSGGWEPVLDLATVAPGQALRAARPGTYAIVVKSVDGRAGGKGVAAIVRPGEQDASAPPDRRQELMAFMAELEREHAAFATRAE